MDPSAPFWETTPLDAMTREQWESLCDGCGRCCLHKIREDDGSILFTNVACRLLDGDSCGCRDYARRSRRVPDCVQLTPSALAEIDWLPQSCAYRRVAEGRGLPDWHHLVSGDREGVHAARVSVRGRVVDERRAGPLEHHVVAWPGTMPRAKRRAPAVAAAGAIPAPDIPAPDIPAPGIPAPGIPDGAMPDPGAPEAAPQRPSVRVRRIAGA